MEEESTANTSAFNFLLFLLVFIPVCMSIEKEILLEWLEVRRLNNHAHAGAVPAATPRNTYQRLEQRKKWSAFVTMLPDKVFKRMFRMSKLSFERLCIILCDEVGEEKFRSESYLATRDVPRTNDATMFYGGYISGEIKVAIALRMLAGSSYLDLLLVYCIGRTQIYYAFHQVIDWINVSLKFKLHPMLDCKDVGSLQATAAGFARFSNDQLDGIIGAIDGIAIRIQCPSESDNVPDPGNYFCRKQFYALNVQAIVDSKKRFLWVSTSHQGSMFDSVAFGQTGLHRMLEELSPWLRRNGFYLIGDSAYNLASWMIIPYSHNASMQSGDVKDSFNFWHSNARIRVECAFGKSKLLFYCW
jgi:hypothetical protein